MLALGQLFQKAALGRVLQDGTLGRVGAGLAGQAWTLGEVGRALFGDRLALGDVLPHRAGGHFGQSRALGRRSSSLV